MPEAARHSSIAIAASVLFVIAAAALLLWLLKPPAPQLPVLVIHGGAGKVEHGPGEAPRRAALREALRRGYAVLDKGGTSLDAVQTVIVFLENSPYFNAGKGAVFNYDGHNEMDAAIMDGRTLNSGAVASVHHVRNPILAARLVMERSKHVMLMGEGADEFAQAQGLAPVPETYFYTEHRWKQFLKARKKEGAPYTGPNPLERAAEEKKQDEEGSAEEPADKTPPADEPPAPMDVPMTPTDKPAPTQQEKSDEGHFGTVGAVALDRHGNLAAGTSTGGLTLKRFGRVGDSPIIGAGTYASNKSCAVSATGIGEYFIRGTIARDICALIEFRGTRLSRAARQIIHGKLAGMGGEGGIIAVDAKGHWTFSFNTEAMMRGVKTPYTEQVAIFRPEGATAEAH